MKRKTAVLFDMDGVVFQSEHAKAEAHAAAVRALGGEIDPAFYETVIGRSAADVSRAMLKRAGISTPPAAYEAAFGAAYQSILSSGVLPSPGIPELLSSLTSHRHLALVTSSRRWMAEILLEQQSWEHMFDVVITADDVVAEKPDPAPWKAALHHLRIPAERTLIFEDSEAGLASARAAGIRAIAVRHALNGRMDLSSASAIIDSFHPVPEILASIETMLPAASSHRNRH